MYWPIGTPRAFAATQEEGKRDFQITSDGIENDGSESAGDQVNGARGNGDAVSSPVRSANLLGLCSNRNGQLFVTWTAFSFSIWNSKPTVTVASVTRSPESLQTYGDNEDVLIRPDSAIFVVHTSGGFLITYTLTIATEHRVYSGNFYETGGTARRNSLAGAKVAPGNAANIGPGEGIGVPGVDVRFRMVIKVDAGIAKALALDEELVVATKKPAAIQCIRWAPDGSGSQTRTELLARMSWVEQAPDLVEMVHNRPMSLSAWITSDGRAYAVQRIVTRAAPERNSKPKLFQGYCFHNPEGDGQLAQKAAINARFSLIAVGCANGDVFVYNARDYGGNIPLSHKLSATALSSSTGTITYLSYSPDGYCTFVGYSNGWAMSSTYGKHTGSSFQGSRLLAEESGEEWFLGTRSAFWLGGGSQIVLAGISSPQFWILDMVRSGVTGCFTPANVTRTLLQTNAGVMVYRGFDVPDMSAISADSALWSPIEVPATYMLQQWPIRSSVISPDGRYIAVAGRRGLAHYSIASGRWKTFEDPAMEDEFAVRGGMCWHRHILIAAVEREGGSYQLRMYSRELPLSNSRVLHTVNMTASVVVISPSGEDSLLVYTYENILHHFMIDQVGQNTRLFEIGQIGLHGIIRAPLRVRAVSWILPEEQIENGDPAQDVGLAAILFLVDGKLVLLNPATSEQGELKYEMRILAQSVEHYALMRDQLPDEPSGTETGVLGILQSAKNGAIVNGDHGQGLRDSLWSFDGQAMQIWPDVQDVLASASSDFSRELPNSVEVPVDFYPLSAVFDKGIVFGLESEVFQKRNTSSSFLRFATRTHLFIPALLRYHLSRYNTPAALHLSHRFRKLDYFPHALEVLLHNVLDEEVDTADSTEQRLLPQVLSFLSPFPEYLDIIVQCTRKTEVRSWRTLFAHLPPPQQLFEESLAKGSLKTAGGYLLVLHTFEELSSSSDQLVRLLRRAKEEQDFELCKELSRFLVALDPSGQTLRDALQVVELIPHNSNIER